MRCYNLGIARDSINESECIPWLVITNPLDDLRAGCERDHALEDINAGGQVAAHARI